MAQTATITGVVLDENNTPLVNVNITSGKNGVSTDTNGFYVLRLTADKKTQVTFTHIGHKKVVLTDLTLTTNETYEFNPVLKTDAIQIDAVTVTPTGQRSVAGIVTISPEIVRKIPGANAGVENILKLLPGVTSNNELSTQYSVRGGNYDENLVYVNDIEVYRPFLIRSAQQEGLSFVNSDLVQSLQFSPGGFQAKYGDKLSSVLDITYKNPTAFGIQADISFLGTSISAETLSQNKKFSSLTGVRYRDNSLFVNSLQTTSNFRPLFADAQSYLTYRFSRKFNLNFLGNVSLNDYRNEPLTRRTNFGTINDPRALIVFYEGEESNQYFSALGALKADYYPSQNTTLKFISSVYHAIEDESSDVIAQYELGQVNTDLTSEDLGEVTSSRGLGTQFNRARNSLDALIVNLSHKGQYKKENQVLAWGATYKHEDIRDKLMESEFLDSLGFSIRPPDSGSTNNEPEEPFDAPLEAFESANAINFVKTNRFTGYLQFSNQTKWKNNNIYYNLGLRAHHWNSTVENGTSSSQTVVSPRAQFSIKPDWEKDMLFRLSGGVYHQPPFYRALRDATGTVNPDVKAQKSVHIVAGNEYSFTIDESPFTLVSEAYYKRLTNVNPYTLEDVRIRYATENNAEAYVYGIEMRMNGAFVPGTESWISLGYLKTEENIDNRGYISRPTDQRFKMGILFQDYIPTIPNLRMYLNLVYSTGVPGGSPSNADPYDFQNRLRDYKRADLGISYIFAEIGNKYSNKKWLSKFKELSVGFEIFNLFNNQNSITNTWVRDVDNKQQFAVPNFLTSRVLNLRLRMRF